MCLRFGLIALMPPSTSEWHGEVDLDARMCLVTTEVVALPTAMSVPYARLTFIFLLSNIAATRDRHVFASEGDSDLLRLISHSCEPDT